MGLCETVLELLTEDQRRRTSKAGALKSQNIKWMLECLTYEEFSPERPSIFTVSMSPTYCSECCHSHFSDEFMSPSAAPFLPMYLCSIHSHRFLSTQDYFCG